MCNSEIQKRVAVERAKALYLSGAPLDSVLGAVWTAGFVEGGHDADPEFDERVEEMNLEIEAEREAQESGSVEPPRLGWLSEIGRRH